MTSHGRAPAKATTGARVSRPPQSTAAGDPHGSTVSRRRR